MTITNRSIIVGRAAVVLVACGNVAVGTGCRTDAPAAGAAGPNLAAPMVTVATLPSSASPGAALPSPSAIAPSAGERDAWYPAGTNQELKLTWALYPVQSDESEAGPKRNIELVARIGDAVKRVPLGPEFGTLSPSTLSVCDPALKKDALVSALYLHTMGPKTIVARRVQPGLLEISWTREADDAPEKIKGTIATIPIPPDARIVDAVQVIRSPGDEAPFDCSGASATYAWTDEVRLTGKVIEKSVESARGGTIKTIFLAVDRPVDIRKGRPNTNETEIKGARELWIGNVLDASGKPAKDGGKGLVGKTVSFRGHFQTSDTGHHHSHPWLQGTFEAR